MINTFLQTVLSNSRTVFVRLLLVGILCVIPSVAHGQEAINSFRSSIDVSQDGSFTVTERIEYSFGSPRHGIFREIPLTHPEKASSFLKTRVLSIDLKDVRLDGEEVPYELESTKSTFKVKIGDPNTTEEGVHEYALVYVVHGGLWYPKDASPELYFNVTGDEWTVPILSAEATVYGKGLFRAEHACYSGPKDSQGSCVISSSDDDTVQFRTVAPLKPGEGMTVAQSLEYGKVAYDVEEQFRTSLVLIPLLLLLILVSVWRVYKYKTKFKTDGPIIPEYEPYPGVKPMYAGLLMDRTLDPRDVTACFVYLAQQGYIKIKHTNKKALFLFEVDDYELTLLRPITDLAHSFEETLLLMLFDSADAAVGKTISLNELKKNHSDQKENYALLQSLREVLRVDLKTQGFFVGFEFSKIFNKKFLGGFAVLILVLWMLASATVIYLVIAAVILFVVVADGRRTLKGYQALNHLKGFKLFLSVTEKERYAFHNAPQKSPEQFMEYLPYAIAFGVEKEWAEVFKDVTITNPDWYDGGSAHSFNAAGISSSLGSFSTALASSGTSASSGGGSSGGGSGGGGGGSW